MIHDRRRRRAKPSPQTAALSVDVFSELVDCNLAVNVWASSANSTAASSETTPTMVHDRRRRRTKPSPQTAALSVDVFSELVDCNLAVNVEFCELDSGGLGEHADNDS